MNKERLTEERKALYEAERLRVLGRWREALEMTRQWSSLKPEEIIRLSPDEIQTKISWWRVWAVTLASLANGTWNGNQAAKFLKESKHVILTYYDNDIVREAAQEMKMDAEGHEYQMAAEMARDKGKHWIKLASLTGDKAYLEAALDEFFNAVEFSGQGTSARALALMETYITARKQGPRFDFGSFRHAYLTVVELAPEAGGWDRQAAVSWWFIQEALRDGRMSDVRMGLKNLTGATQKLGVSWWRKYLLKDIVGKGMEISRRITYRGDYRELEL